MLNIQDKRKYIPIGSRDGTHDNFSKIQVSAIKNKYIFAKSINLFTWVPQGAREGNFSIIVMYQNKIDLAGQVS